MRRTYRRLPTFSGTFPGDQRSKNSVSNGASAVGDTSLLGFCRDLFGRIA
jgi:hypothetical protein